MWLLRSVKENRRHVWRRESSEVMKHETRNMKHERYNSEGDNIFHEKTRNRRTIS
jgi:hypothetical protein